METIYYAIKFENDRFLEFHHIFRTQDELDKFLGTLTSEEGDNTFSGQKSFNEMEVD